MARELDCYAKTLNTCGGGITQEHIISEALLGERIICDFNGKEQSFTKEEFALPILCKEHNGYFSKIESHVLQFHQKLVDSASMFEIIRNHSLLELKSMVRNRELKMPYKISVNGWFLEKWLLKTAINYAFMMDETRRPRFQFNYINKRLFSNERFGLPFGVSMFHPKEQTNYKYPGGIYFDFAEGENGIHAIAVNLQGYLFCLLLPSEGTNDIVRTGVRWNGEDYKFDENLIYHPVGESQFVTTKDGEQFKRTELIIDWKI